MVALATMREQETKLLRDWLKASLSRLWYSEEAASCHEVQAHDQKSRRRCMSWHGMVRVAAAPRLGIALRSNSANLCQLLSRAVQEDVAIVVFPELLPDRLSCGDLFHQQSLLDDA